MCKRAFIETSTSGKKPKRTIKLSKTFRTLVSSIASRATSLQEDRRSNSWTINCNQSKETRKDCWLSICNYFNKYDIKHHLQTSVLVSLGGKVLSSLPFILNIAWICIRTKATTKTNNSTDDVIVWSYLKGNEISTLN